MLLNRNRSSVTSAPGEETMLEVIFSLLLLLSKSKVCSRLKSAASASLNMLPMSSTLLSPEVSVPKHGMDSESLFSDSHGDSRPMYGCETSAEAVVSREKSVGSPGAEKGKFVSNDVVDAVDDASEVKQLLSVDKSVDTGSGVAIGKDAVAGKAKFKLPMSSILKSIVVQLGLIGLM